MGNGAKRAERRAVVVKLLGGRCVNCGNSDVRVLQIDHKHNDGNKLKRGGRIRGFDLKHFNAIIRGEDPLDRYQLLCANCHALKNLGFLWSSTTSNEESKEASSPNET